MTAIRREDVIITLYRRVDCMVCGEGVETDEDLRTLEDARAARDRHLEEHERGYRNGPS